MRVGKKWGETVATGIGGRSAKSSFIFQYPISLQIESAKEGDGGRGLKTKKFRLKINSARHVSCHVPPHAKKFFLKNFQKFFLLLFQKTLEARLFAPCTKRLHNPACHCMNNSHSLRHNRGSCPYGMVIDVYIQKEDLITNNNNACWEKMGGNSSNGYWGALS